MRIEVTHALGRDEAIRRLDPFLDNLVTRQWPGGVSVANARKQWEGPRLQFGFDAGASGFRVTINGTLDVTDDGALLDANLPMIVRLLVGENRIREVVAKGLTEALNGSAQ
jgi:hypothetical protein